MTPRTAALYRERAELQRQLARVDAALADEAEGGIVRARPSAEPTPQPTEASAVEVLRELVAHRGECAAYERLDSVDAIVDRARVVLAAAGPDPMPVVRAAMAWAEGGRTRTEAAELLGALSGAVDAYRKAGGK